MLRNFSSQSLSFTPSYKLATGVRINVRAMGKYRGATQRATNVARGGKEIPLESFPSFCQRNAYPPFFLSSPPPPRRRFTLYLSCFCSLTCFSTPRAVKIYGRASGKWRGKIKLPPIENNRSDALPRDFLTSTRFLPLFYFLDAFQTSVIQWIIHIIINSLI